MAKKKEQTPEEFLEEALVPEHEQPYQLPDGWVWVRFESVNLRKNGKTIEPNKFPNKTFELYSVPSFDDIFPEIINGKEIKSSKQVVDIGNVLLCKINPRINRVWSVGSYSDNPKIASGEWIIISTAQYCDGSYLQYYLSSPIFREFFLENVSGVGGSLMRARPKDVANYPIPLPSLKEQIRIADKLDSMLGKIKEAREKIQEARDTFANRRASILHKAFTGELTNYLRSKHQWHDWIVNEFQDIAEIKSNLVEPGKYGDMPHIAPDSIEKETGRLIRFNTIEEDGVKSPKHRFHKGQIIYSKIRPYLSKLIIADFDGLCSADMYPIETKLNTKYLYWYMLSPTFVDYASNAGSRSVLPKINQKELSVIPVHVPSLEEQKEIVRILDKLLDFEEEAKRLSDLEKHLDLLEKSILNKAFRGELNTSDPSDEPAMELLKRMASLRN